MNFTARRSLRTDPSLRAEGRMWRFAKPIRPSLQDPQLKANPLASQGLAPLLISPDFFRFHPV